jgi:ankyrin repeat protein
MVKNLFCNIRCLLCIFFFAGALHGQDVPSAHFGYGKAFLYDLVQRITKAQRLLSRWSFDMVMGITPLHRAAAAGDEREVENLIKAGALIDPRSLGNFTPLHLAVIRNHTSTVSKLLENGADVNTANRSGLTPLHSAVEKKYLNVVKELLAAKAQVNTLAWPDPHILFREIGTVCSMTPLHTAALNGDEEILKELLAHGVDSNAENSHGATPLSIAVFKGRREIVKMLLDSAADVNKKLILNTTVLHVAAFASRDENLIQLLVERGADVNAVSTGGPIDSRCDFMCKINWLVNGIGFETPLHQAAEADNDVAARIFIKAGANIRAVDKRGFTPAMIAEKNGHKKALDVITKIYSCREIKEEQENARSLVKEEL